MDNPFLLKYLRKRRLDKHYFSAITRHFGDKRVCFFCLGERMPYQVLACSPKCLKQIDLRSSTGLLRREILERDNFSCRKCGVRGDSIRVALKIYKKAYPHLYDLKLEELKIPKSRGVSRPSSMLDVDHIVKVADGGGAGIPIDVRDNCQLLCLYCHYFKDNKPPKGVSWCH